MTDPTPADSTPTVPSEPAGRQWRVFAQPLVIGGLIVALAVGVGATLGIQALASIHPRAVSASRAASPEHTAKKVVFAPLASGKTTLKDTEAQLQKLGLVFDVAAAAGTSAPTPDWYVIKASPSGENVPPGSTIHLTAQAPAVVPNFVGGTVAQAKASAQSAGLILDVGTYDDDWKVDSQALAAGSPQPPGALIGIHATEPPQFDTYTVTGNGTANVITYSTGGTGSSQASNVRLPWSVQIPAGGDFLYVSAQDGSGTTITCTITGPGGAVLATNTATGRYAIAQCNN